MPAGKLTVAQFRRRLPDLLAEVDLPGRRYVVMHKGHPRAVLIGLADLARLEALEEDEDALEIKPPRGVRDPCAPDETPGVVQSGVDAGMVDGYVRLRPGVPSRFRTRLSRGRHDL
jgi:prevent-host-death family protein